MGLHAPLCGPGRGGGHRYPQPVRLRRAGGQGRVSPPPGVRPVRPAGVRLCLRHAGEGESTTDLVFTGHNMIAENGALLAERRFAAGLTISEIDVQRLAYERRRNTTFTPPARTPWRRPLLGVSRGLLQSEGG
mgnify:CR=1 FL=1